jgi:DNA modification methylase
MKFDPRQGKALQEFIEPIARELFRVLVPGGFFISFSQPRLFHRLAVAAENAGFEIRDMFAWHYTKRAQFKAFSMRHFVEKMKIPEKKKRAILRELRGRKTPQLRPQFEALMLAQRPREGTFVDNWLKYKAGLIDAKKSLDGSPPSTVMLVEKPVKEEYNTHLAVKPVLLLAHLIELFTCVGQLVLDPFLGTGSTALAAMRTGRSCIGIEINPEYVDIAEHRIKESKK